MSRLSILLFAVVTACGGKSTPPPTSPPPTSPSERRPVPDLMPDDVLSSMAGEDTIGPVDDAARAVHQAEDWLVDGQRRDAIQHGVVAPYYRELERALRHVAEHVRGAPEMERIVVELFASARLTSNSAFAGIQIPGGVAWRQPRRATPPVPAVCSTNPRLSRSSWPHREAPFSPATPVEWKCGRRTERSRSIQARRATSI